MSEIIEEINNIKEHQPAEVKRKELGYYWVMYQNGNDAPKWRIAELTNDLGGEDWMICGNDCPCSENEIQFIGQKIDCPYDGK